MKTSISVVIPAFNVEDTIDRCVRSALAQSVDGASFEVIVVDNGSTDETLRIVAKHPVRVVSEKKRGRSAARNRGVAEAAGSIIAFLDADCVAPPNWLAESVQSLKHTWVGAVQARIRKHGQQAPPRVFVQGYYYVPFMDTAGLVTTRRAFDDARGFDEELPRNVDADFTFRLLASGYALAWIPDVIIVKYHYLGVDQAWRRGVEGGVAGSQLERKWQDLVPGKSRARRYRSRVRSLLRSCAVSILDPESSTRLVMAEQWPRLLHYAHAEFSRAKATKHSFEPVTPLRDILGRGRFLLLCGQEADIFDSNHERRIHLSAVATAELRARIEGARIEAAQSRGE